MPVLVYMHIPEDFALGEKLTYNDYKSESIRKIELLR